MNWHNVRLIWARETRDQLRDRRMLFMICVLPILLYPLLGTSFMQLAQFMKKHESVVWVIGAEQLKSARGLPPLITRGQLTKEILDDYPDAKLLEVEIKPAPQSSNREAIEEWRNELLAGKVDVVVYFPKDFAAQLNRVRAEVRTRRENNQTARIDVPRPSPMVLFNPSREASELAHGRVERVLGRWNQQIFERILQDSDVPLNITQPFELDQVDVSGRELKQAAFYSKLLPFFVFLWALTGAFYPAVDLCAGEKERGTLEALLTSPAQRSEIVWGKLLTVMLFSVFTAVLNLASMGFTAAFVSRQIQAAAPNASEVFALPSPISILWIGLALLPIAALFSALSLACAAFARSTKEGQYYFMPLFMVTLPLMLAPMSPGTELTLGNSLIPITGLTFLLRALMEGQYARALPFVLPVVAVTLGCCWLATRWAIEQFNQESVLFRENERFELRAWLVHLVRDRKPTPTVGAALACVAIIFVVKFFAGLAIAPPAEDAGVETLAWLVLVPQLCIVVPALVMAVFFTSDPRQTLLIRGWPKPSTIFAAAALAICYLPVGRQLAVWIMQLYPFDPQTIEILKEFENVLRSTSLGVLLLLMAVVPAICEELAFRGFVLSGLRHLGHKWWAIVLTAVFFGMAHSAFLQQSLSATAAGVLIGYIALKSGHLAPCITFHFAYNGLSFALAQVDQWLAQHPGISKWLQWFYHPSASELQPFTPVAIALGGMGTILLLWWFHRLDAPQSPEERLTEARQQPIQRPFAQDLS